MAALLLVLAPVFRSLAAFLVHSPHLSCSYGITINVAQVARPPVIIPQNRTILESAVGGTFLPPALVASQPQGLPFNFSVSPTTVFGIQQTTGLLFLQVCSSICGQCS